MALRLRALTEEERTQSERLTRAQTAPVRLVVRARIVQLAATGLSAPASAAQLGISAKGVRLWLLRCTHAGLDGLADAPRAGRPRPSPDAASSRVIATARSLPPQPTAGPVPPPCHWTVDRLQAELANAGLPITGSQIRRILQAAHRKWQQPRTWLDSAEPLFAENRGRSSGSTAGRRRAARS